MTPVLFLLAGIAIGLATAAPVGPVNVLAVSTALRRGRAAALAVGAGAVAADTLLALVAVLGVGVVVEFVEGHETSMGLAGATVMVAFGLATLLRRPHLPAAGDGPAARGHGQRMLVPFVMTATNPGAVLGMFALVGALRAATGLDDPALRTAADEIATVAGVALGGALWWIFVAVAVTALRDRVDDRLLGRVNLGAGVLLVLAGLVLGARALLHLP